MSPVYIIDSYSLLAMPTLCKPHQHLGHLLTEMTEMVRAGALTFPNLVVKECKKYGSGEFPTMWADAASGHRRNIAPPYEFMETVLDLCPDVADWDDSDESVQVEVLTLALFRGASSEVIIVTEDTNDVPERMCLLKAANQLNIPAVTFPEFLRASGHQAYLN